jgi:hypothetical protein
VPLTAPEPFAAGTSSRRALGEIKTVPNHCICSRAHGQPTILRWGEHCTRAISRSRSSRKRLRCASGRREASTPSSASPARGRSPNSAWSRPALRFSTARAVVAPATTRQPKCWTWRSGLRPRRQIGPGGEAEPAPREVGTSPREGRRRGLAAYSPGSRDDGRHAPRVWRAASPSSQGKQSPSREVKERRKLGEATPELASLTNGTGGLITHVGSDPAHQEQHCLRSGWAILQCRRARRQRDPLSCLQSANRQA